MAVFPSFRASSMPKRLLRYALSRLELLDAEALDTEKLDFALGRNTVFEFRDVGIRLKKLDKLLQLPPALQLSRAKILLLRVTIPMDSYTSPITVDVDRVEVHLQVAPVSRDGPSQGKTPPSAHSVVPDPVDLAQSFLQTQPSSERKELEQAFVAETQDLAASVALSDDGGEEEPSTFATGQPSSLPDFLASFLQGIVDRMQIMIKHVRFQLDMQVSGLETRLLRPALEPVSIQIALESIDVEGVTTVVNAAPTSKVGSQHQHDPEHSAVPQPAIISKQGKRHISLANVRAYLISEANIFSAFAPSPPMTAPSVAAPSAVLSPSIPLRPSASLLSQGSFREQPMASLQQSFRQRLSRDRSTNELDDSNLLGDSEEALSIPHDHEDESPATPRASATLGELQTAPRHSSTSSLSLPTLQFAVSGEQTADHLTSAFDRGLLPLPPAARDQSESTVDGPFASRAEYDRSMEDLSESHVYTHEEAASMYMSAFSTAEPRSSASASQLSARQGHQREASEAHPPSPSILTSEPAAIPSSSPSAMPGAWDDDFENTTTGNPDETKGTSAAMIPSFIPESAASDLAALESTTTKSKGEADERSTDQNDAPKSRATSRVSKEFLHLDNVSVYMPSHHQPQNTQVHAVASSLFANDSTFQPPPLSSCSQTLGPENPGSQMPPAPISTAVELVLSPLKVYLDISSGCVLVAVVETLLEAIRRKSPVSAASCHKGPVKDNDDKTPELRLAAQEISVRLLNHLSGIADSAERGLDPLTFTVGREEETLLSATLQNLNLSLTPSSLASSSTLSRQAGAASCEDTTVIKIGFERFGFGYADGDIVSFDDSRPITASVKDTFLPDGQDIGVKITQSLQMTTIDVETLPIVVQLDLQRLDESLGWFGELSSILNMSFPTTSSHSAAAAADHTTPSMPPWSRPKPAVHFQTPAADRRCRPGAENQQHETPKSKINVRIGGALVELAGRECSIAAETSAIKLVGRSEGFGVACSRIRFSGPYPKNDGRGHHHHSYQTAPLTTEVAGLRLELSSTPEDRDLEKLLELITPSNVKFDDDVGGEIMVETLLRQRRKGSALRANIESVHFRAAYPAELLPALPNLAEEIAKLSAMVAAKYLAADDRPGILILARLHQLGVTAKIDERIGLLEGQVCDLEAAHITFPSLVALAIGTLSVRRNGNEDLICHGTPPCKAPSTLQNPQEKRPAIMTRVIGDEMDPLIKVKLRDLRIEYHVSTIMDALGLEEESLGPLDFEASLAASVAGLADRAGQPLLRARQAAENAERLPRSEKERPAIVEIWMRDCLIGLNPRNLPSKMVLALTDAHAQATVPPTDGPITSTAHIKKASLLLTDDLSEIKASATPSGRGASLGRHRRGSSVSSTSLQTAELCARGFVEICYISSASITTTIKPTCSIDPTTQDGRQVEVELRDDLLVLETCADSTQTLIALVNALKPPTPPSKDDKYRTKVVPVQDLLASISAEAFGKPEGDYDFDYDFSGAQELAGAQDLTGSSSDADYAFGNQPPAPAEPYGTETPLGAESFDATAHTTDAGAPTMQDTAEGVLLTGVAASRQESLVNDSSDELLIHEEFYGRDESSGESQTAKLWNPTTNTFDMAPAALVKSSPLKLSVKDVHVIWNLFDGYDWARTRDAIAKAVEEVEIRATECQQCMQRLGGGGASLETYEEEMEDETIGDFLFNSIYIGVPLNRDPRELTGAINRGLDDGDEDTATETESVTTATTATTRKAQKHTRHHSMRGRHGPGRRLRLHRSRHHKITFELRGVGADVVVFPSPDTFAAAPGDHGAQQTLSSIDVRVRALDIFDHVPTSTWKKFATYDRDQGEREMGSDMVHLEFLSVRPIPDLDASEMVMRAAILPLRLHVDQDALDFITRFFEFKEETGSTEAPSPPASSPASDVPFLQRAEVLDIPVKLDFKPKRVDYAGLRSGHTTEFMNLIVLEESRLILRHVIVYGVSGFDRLGKTLNDIWTPDVRKNQLPGVVAGLAPVRSLVNIGSGFKDLVEIPLREYRKDGRVIRSISKGAAAFARTTGTELVKLGAKLAVGMQYALQGAEEMLLERRLQPQPRQWPQMPDGCREGEEDDLGFNGGDFGELDEDRKQLSLYADQPTGVLQGLRSGYRSLTRDINLTRDAIIAIPGEVIESATAGGVARAVLRRAPTIIFRPAVGVSKAIGQTLMGATNTIDPHNRRRIDEKYKH